MNEAVEEVLTDVGLSQTIGQMPSELSGGQKKRIGIARTLILHPEIMLYDEPTGGIDPVTCVELNHLINKVQKQYNTSSIIITHDLACAKMTGNRVAMLVEGKISRQGSFDEIFNTDDPDIRGFYNYNFISQTMKTGSINRAVIVGIFIFLGIAIFVTGVFTLGSERKTFANSIDRQSDISRMWADCRKEIMYG